MATTKPPQTTKPPTAKPTTKPPTAKPTTKPPATPTPTPEPWQTSALLRQAATSLAIMVAAGIVIYVVAKLAQFTPAVAMYHALVYAFFFGVYLLIPFEEHFFVPAGEKLSTGDKAYYAMVTHSGVGYGDIYPTTTPARLLVTLHLFMVIIASMNMVSVGTSTVSYGGFPGAQLPI